MVIKGHSSELHVHVQCMGVMHTSSYLNLFIHVHNYVRDIDSVYNVYSGTGQTEPQGEKQ